MTTYNQLAGYRVNYLGSDPTLNTGNEGQVWYNSTSGTLKSLVKISAWTSAGSMGTARYALGSAGTQTAGLGFGGSPPFAVGLASTEAYSGYTWTAGGNLGTARYNLGGSGTQTAALAFGGFVLPPSLPQGINQNATEFNFVSTKHYSITFST